MYKSSVEVWRLLFIFKIQKEPSCEMDASHVPTSFFPQKLLIPSFFFPHKNIYHKIRLSLRAPCNTFFYSTSLATQNISIGIELDSIIVEERYITHSYYFFDDEGKVPGLVESVRSARVYKLQISCDL